MYFIHTDTMTVIKAIYSPILATFLVGGMCVLFPLLKFDELRVAGLTAIKNQSRVRHP